MGMDITSIMPLILLIVMPARQVGLNVLRFNDLYGNDPNVGCNVQVWRSTTQTTKASPFVMVEGVAG